MKFFKTTAQINKRLICYFFFCKIENAAAAAAKSLQSCLTLWDPIDGSPPGSHVPGILQARTLAWAAISFSNVWKWKVKVKSLSRVRLLATPRTAAQQAPPSMGFSRQEYWSGLPLPSPQIENKKREKAVFLWGTWQQIVVSNSVIWRYFNKGNIGDCGCG